MSFEAPVSNRADAVRAFNDNKLYFARGGNLAMCETFMDACLFLLQTPLVRTEHVGEVMELRPDIVQKFYEDARRWYDTHYSRLSSNSSRLRYAEGDW